MVISKIEKATFKSTVSIYYPGDNFLWLRCCLHGIVPGGELSSARIGIELFNIIEKQEGFVFTVSILAEIAELTHVYAAKEYIKTFKSNTNMEYSNVNRLTQYRKRLFKTLKQIGNSKSVGLELTKISSYYEVKELNFTNIWDLVFHLERETLLGDDLFKIQTFADQLVGEAKNILTGVAAADNTQPGTQSIGSQPVVKTPSSTTCSPSNEHTNNDISVNQQGEYAASDSVQGTRLSAPSDRHVLPIISTSTPSQTSASSSVDGAIPDTPANQQDDAKSATSLHYTKKREHNAAGKDECGNPPMLQL